MKTTLVILWLNVIGATLNIVVLLAGIGGLVNVAGAVVAIIAAAVLTVVYRIERPLP